MRLIKAFAMIATIGFTGSVVAKSGYPSLMDSSAKTLYGANAGYSTSNCTACHGNSIPSLPNKFGTDFKAKYSALGYSTSLSQTQMDNVIKGMETLDSDADGANTKAELMAKTDPGDANSKPPAIATCVAAAPSLSLDAISKTGAPGDSLNFTVSIKNNDSSACQNATFSLASTVPTGFTGSLAMQSVVLAPGASSSVVLSVKSPVGQADGNYPFSVASSDSAQALHASKVDGTYVVKAAVVAVCTRNAPTVTLSPASQSGAVGSSLTYKLNIVNNDTAACAQSNLLVVASGSAPLAVTASAANLALTPGQSGSVNLSVKSDANAVAGSYKFKASVSDSNAAITQHVGSTEGSYVVTASNGADVTAPTAPANLRAKVGCRGVKLRWEASTDNVGVTEYVVFVDGKEVAETTRLSKGLWLEPGEHEIVVKAEDAAQNVSNASNAVRVKIEDKRGSDIGKILLPPKKDDKLQDVQKLQDQLKSLLQGQFKK